MCFFYMFHIMLGDFLYIMFLRNVFCYVLHYMRYLMLKHIVVCDVYINHQRIHMYNIMYKT